MATRNFLQSSQRLFFQSLRSANFAANGKQVLKYSKTTSSEQTGKDDDLDQPVQFSSSKASEPDDPHQHKYRTNKPEYEHLIAQVSVATFLLYFCFLREENDWDVGLFDDIYSKVPDLELVVLRQKKKDGLATGLGLSPEEELRLKELEKELGMKRT
ncbi:Protein CCSMST1 [Frankliniella fusca]|uniref:Protein CCSMST1 n=1 Tax=Frankliniella fusca TaxID=407009 RepID=A0AAE1LAT0_9NEOP|nr:Protein CCSMST1 [Frankliniella fusca]